jgi:glycosyltransferase involved in cell wall biosynthesis
VRRLAPWLVGRGHDVCVYGRAGLRGRPARLITADGVRVHETRGLSSKSLSTLSHGATASFDAARTKPDVVLALNVANGIWLPALRLRGVPVVVNVDGIEWKRAKWGVAARTTFRLGAHMTARLANQLVADSEEIARIWNEEFDVQPTFIPYGADIERDVRSDRVHDLGLVREGYVLVVARLVPENNVDLLLDALDLMGPTPAVIVGSANYRYGLEDRLRHRSDGGLLRWLGHVEDQELLRQLWAHAGAYFHGHSVGGTNPALLQALGLGAPVIAIDTPFNREVLRSEDRLVEPRAEAVAARLTHLLADEGERERAREFGQATICDSYRWNDVLARYERLLLETAAEGPSRRLSA